MNFPKFHTHKWVALVESAKRFTMQIKDSSQDSENLRCYKTLVYGLKEKNTPEFAGLKTYLLYWISMEKKMKFDYNYLASKMNSNSLIHKKDLLEKAERYFDLFLEDVGVFIHKINWDIFDELEIERLKNDIVKEDSRGKDNWFILFNHILNGAERVLSGEQIEWKNNIKGWIELCLKYRLAQEYETIKSAVITHALAERIGKKRIETIIEKHETEFGYELANLLFNEIGRKVNFTKEEKNDSLNFMRADHYIIEEGDKTGRRVKMALMFPIYKIMKKPFKRIVIFKNCPIYAAYEKINELDGIARKSVGNLFCPFCESHARATMQIFLPLFLTPKMKLTSCLGKGDSCCTIESEVYLKRDRAREAIYKKYH